MIMVMYEWRHNHDVKNFEDVSLVGESYIPLLYAIFVMTVTGQNQVSNRRKAITFGNQIDQRIWWIATMPTTITTDVSNYGAPGAGDGSHTMKALTWQSKNSVKVGPSYYLPEPAIDVDCL
jgi:hypothetical protein